LMIGVGSDLRYWSIVLPIQTVLYRNVEITSQAPIISGKNYTFSH
jgi:hypothetical protein